MGILFPPFCRVITDDCISKLVLRREIFWMVRQGRYRLRLAYGVGGFPDGCIWDVKLEQKRDTRNVLTCCSFTDGWDLFAQDVCLTTGDTLVFKLVEEDLMSVEVYNQHGLLKEEPVALENSSSGEEEEVSSDDLSCLGDGTGDHNRGRDCNIRLTGCKSSCTIPKRFAVYHRLDSLSEVEIIDPVGMVWKVEVETAPANRRYNHLPVCERPHRYRFKKGWRNFYIANELGKGQCIHFEVNPDGTLSATIY